MVLLFIAAIIALCAVFVRINPELINTMSEEQCRRMDIKKTGRVAFWELMTTALIMIILYIVGIRNELVPIFVCIPSVIITAALIQCSIPNK